MAVGAIFFHRPLVLAIWPEAPHSEVSTSVGLPVGGAMAKGFTGEWQQLRFHFHVVAYLLHTLRQKVSDIIVAHVDESCQFAYLWVVQWILCPTRTCWWEVGDRPAVLQVHHVEEVRLALEVETVLRNRQSRQDAGGALQPKILAYFYADYFDAGTPAHTVGSIGSGPDQLFRFFFFFFGVFCLLSRLKPNGFARCGKLKGHLRALPTEIISPAKWRSYRKWRPTNGPADRLATKFPKISSFWWVLQWAAATAGPGNMSLRASAPRKHRSFSFFSSSLKLMDDWPPRSTSTRRMEAYGTSRNVESFYLGAGLTTCWIMEAEETTRQSHDQVRLRRSG